MNNNIAKSITYLRKKNNLTQKELAEKLGVSDKSISKWENGTTSPDYSIISDLSKIFGVSKENIMDFNFDNPKNKLKQKLPIFIIIFLVLATLIILLYLYFHQSKTYIISSENDNITFDGYIILSNDKNVIKIDDFSYIGDISEQVIQYDIYLKNNDDIVYAYYSDVIPKDTALNISEILENTSINVIDNNQLFQLMINNKLKDAIFLMEYTTINNERDVIKTKIKISKVA